MDLYLDGTAEYYGARELPSEDREANVLIVDPNGKSTFLTTPEAKANDNLELLTMEVALRTNGSAEVTGNTVVVGQTAPSYRRGYESASTRKNALEQSWGQVFPGLTVQKVSVSDTSKIEDDVKLDYQLQIPRYAESAPNGLRFSPFGSGRGYTQTFASLAERRFDLVMQNPWATEQTFRYTLPEGYVIGELPAKVTEKTEFGELSLEYALEGKTVVCKSRFAIDVARVKADAYPKFRAFLLRVDQAFSRKLIATKVGGTTASAAP